jgi:putative nucleotidyltransferase with HDIG domain
MSQWLLKYKRRLAVANRERFTRWAKTPRYRTVCLVTGLVLGVGLVLLALLIYPAPELFTPQDWPDVGDVATEDIVASVDFPINKTPKELAEERRLAEARAPLILSYDRAPVDSVFRLLEVFFDRLDSLSVSSLSNEVLTRRLQRDFPWINLETVGNNIREWSVLRADFLDILRGFYVAGVFPDRQYLPFSESNFVLVVKPNREIPLARDRILDVQDVRRSLTTEILEATTPDEELKQSLADFAEQFVVANLEFDLAETEARQEQAMAEIRPIKIKFFKGDRIVRKYQRVTAEHVARLHALSEYMVRKTRHENPLASAMPIVARFVLIGLCVAGMGIYLVFFQRREVRRISSLLALASIWAGMILIAYAVQRTGLSEYMIPIAVSSILVTVLFNLGMGIFNTICLSILLGVLTGFNFSLTFVNLAVGMVTAYSVRRVHHRYDFYRPVLYGAVTYVILIYLLETLRFQETGVVLAGCGIGVMNAFFSAILCIGLLPVFESLFGFTTDLTLLELSDLNHPLLRRLSLEAPGTYHHSLVIGAMVEAAAEAVGANALLARVGAYYHDVGKIDKPEYFIENQTVSRSRHDKLAPSMSALILESHVKIGRDLAMEYDLPDKIIDFIEQHHGTTLMEFFLHKARQQSPDDPVDVEEFRYPGPKPQSRESAILMLADSTEAVSRTLDDPKPNRLRTAIHNVVHDKFEAGQLDECELTLKDLGRIEESFLHRLLGAFHKRVEYPEKKTGTAT